MDIPERGIAGNDATEEELWNHRLEFADARDVWRGSAKYFRQPARDRINASGQVSRQPSRLLMIGRDRGGRLLTFVIEPPNSNGRSHVVTGWESDDEERTRYDRPGGRLRIR